MLRVIKNEYIVREIQYTLWLNRKLAGGVLTAKDRFDI